MNTWIGVVSRSHVERGVAGGFAQMCHGKSRPLARMEVGDVLIYYSPKTDMTGGEPLREFTALGTIVDAEIQQVDLGGSFCPFRRRVAYLAVKAAPITPLLPGLHFAQQGSWGMTMRRGHFAIDEHDRKLIVRAMGVTT